jgi:hypothetical protein
MVEPERFKLVVVACKVWILGNTLLEFEPWKEVLMVSTILLGS